MITNNENLLRDTVEDLLEEYEMAMTVEEVEALTASNKERELFGLRVQAAHNLAMERLAGQTPVMPQIEVPIEEAPAAPAAEPTVDDRIALLLAQIAELKQSLTKSAPKAAKPRVDRQYKLLKTDVSWSTKPQVHALMRILAAHVEVGETVYESQIVQMMEENVAVLATRQGGKRIWDYYKGTSNDGLEAHGNVQKL